ncbi:MAG: alpha/beta hydrolase-fold protein [Candidatus Choladocola sp.]|nr:alpha/beta hydrolase-fold protein [Candidatus Choladocola sp.]
MIERWNVAIPELTGDERRGVYVYLPESYNYDPGRRYPVLYMFDGHNVFFDSDATYGKCWGMKEYMDYTGTQLIIAAVECNHSPDNGRLKEYTPFPFSEPTLGKIDARGEITMNWFVHTFKKEIDRRYRTLADRSHTFIAGSSMGGLMSIYALTEYNDFFSRAAALSPSIWVAPRKLEQMVRAAKLPDDTVLYMDYGELELSSHPGILRQFAKLSSLLMEKGVLVTSRIIPGGTHCEASWERQLPLFMNTLMY